MTGAARVAVALVTRGGGVRNVVRSSVHRLYTILPVAPLRRLLYAKAHRRLLRLHAPRRFSEKVNWRIAYDRRERLAWTCDKLRMKEAASRDGALVPETLWIGRDLDELRGVDLPQRWVLKPNHRTGLVYVGTGQPDVDELRHRTRGWLDESQWRVRGEWAYGRARPLYLIEEWIGDEEQSPPDYKVFVFDGVPALIQVDHDRFGDHTRRLYRSDWSPLDTLHTFPLAPVEPPPAQLQRMLDLARGIGAAFDFIRVDLYVWGDEVYLSEVTPYPGGGLETFHPDALDFELGRKWNLPGRRQQ